MQHWADYLASLVIASARKQETDAACEHPRIASLRRDVTVLEASDEQKLSLLQSIEVFREKFTAGRQVAHLWSHHRDGSEKYDEVSDLDLLLHYLPGMALEISLYKISKKYYNPDADRFD